MLKLLLAFSCLWFAAAGFAVTAPEGLPVLTPGLDVTVYLEVFQ